MEKYIQKITIQSYHTNQYSKATVCSLFQFMLEAAWAHAQVMDWGYDHLQNQNMFWVLSRMYIEIEKYPVWKDTIILTTWSTGTDGIFAYREFIFEDENKEVYLRGNSAWLILDAESKKIVLLRDYLETFPHYSGSSACRAPKRIRPQKQFSQMNFYPVLFSDLDMNKHFNSVKTLERVLDHFGIDFLSTYEPSAIEVNYHKEGLAGDKLAVSNIHLAKNNYQSSIIRERDLTMLSTIEINWKPIS